MNEKMGQISGPVARRSGIGVGVLAAALAMFTALPVWAQQDGGDGAPPPPPQTDGQQGGGGRGFGGQGGFGGGRQFNGQGGPGGGGPVTVSRVPFDFLAASLKLSSEQAGKVAIVLIEARDADNSTRPAPGMGGGDGGPGGGIGGSAGGGSGSRAKQRQAEAAVQSQIEGLLNDTQKSRLTSVLGSVRALQAVGIPPFAITKLGLTDKQIDDLAALATPDGDRPERGANQAPEARKKAREAVKAVLSSDQVAMVNTYINRTAVAQRNRAAGGGPGFGQDGGGPGGPGADGGGPGGADGGPGGGAPPPPPGPDGGAQ